MTPFRAFTVLTGLVWVMAAPAATAQQERDWGAIERCAAIGDAGQRHACLDGVLDALGLLEQAPAGQRRVEARAQPQPTRAQPPATTVSEQHPPASPAASDGIVYAPVTTEAREIDAVTSTVASARLDPGRWLEVEAANGTRWRSTAAISLRRTPRTGAPFSVERGALGSYNCRIESSTYFKCERLS